MSDWARFFETAGQLYSMWPGLFNWAAGLILPVMAVLVTAGWWVRGYKAETREAALEGKVALLEQRLFLATEQQKFADAQARTVESVLPDALQASATEVPKDIPVYDPKLLTTETLRRLLDANNAVSATLRASSDDETSKWQKSLGKSA